MRHIVRTVRRSCFVTAVLVVAAFSAAEGPAATGYARPYDVIWSRGFTEGLGEIEVNGKWGFIDARGKIVVAPKYDQVTPFSGGLAAVRTGTVINTPKAALFGLAGSWCFVARDGREVGRGEYAVCLPFTEGLAGVAVRSGRNHPKPERFGFAAPDGKLAIPAKYISVLRFSEGFAVYEDVQQLKGYVDLRGNEIIPPRFRLAGPFRRGRTVVLENDDYKIINTNGEQIATLPYEQVQEFSFSDGRCAVYKNGKWGFVNDSGELVVACSFEWLGPCHEGLAAAEQSGKLGFINRQGVFVIEPQFDGVPEVEGANRLVESGSLVFSEGLAAVAMAGKWGYISRNGKWTIKPQFDKAGPFTEGVAKVAVNNRLGYINRTGNYIWSPTR